MLTNNDYTLAPIENLRQAPDFGVPRYIYLLNMHLYLNIGKRAFYVSAPTIWNQLPITTKSFETKVIFRKTKTEHIFVEHCFCTIHVRRFPAPVSLSFEFCKDIGATEVYCDSRF